MWRKKKEEKDSQALKIAKKYQYDNSKHTLKIKKEDKL